MATVCCDPRGFKRILFISKDGTRKVIRLGKVKKREADEFKHKVEALNAAVMTGVSPDGETCRWLADISDTLHIRLARAGLVAPRTPPAPQQCMTLATLTQTYISSRTDLKERTHINLDMCARRLIEFFGADRAIDTISEGDADEWVNWLRGSRATDATGKTLTRKRNKKYANATAGRTIKRAKQFFKFAYRKKFIHENPFADAKAPGQVNEGRKFFVTASVAYKLLDACPDTEWRLIVALSRFGGLRCPSEHLALTWDDVDWGNNRIRIKSSKTEHHTDGGVRFVPIFPELRPCLEEAFTLAPEGTVYVINRSRNPNVNLRTSFLRIIRRAGLEPWPKLFHNMRASRETELAEEYPQHVVCKWIGNKAGVAQDHYLQVTDEHFRRGATTTTAQMTADQSGAKSGALDPKTGGADSGAASSRIARSDSQIVSMTQENRAFTNKNSEPTRLAADGCGDVQKCLVPLVGLEPTTL